MNQIISSPSLSVLLGKRDAFLAGWKDYWTPIIEESIGKAYKIVLRDIPSSEGKTGAFIYFSFTWVEKILLEDFCDYRGSEIDLCLDVFLGECEYTPPEGYTDPVSLGTKIFPILNEAFPPGFTFERGRMVYSGQGE